MPSKVTLIGLISVCAALVVAWGCAKKADDTGFKVAFVYVGPVGDGGWTYAHDEGRRFLEASGQGITTKYIENVAEGADAEQAIRTLARQKFDLIVTTSFGFMDATQAIAQEFPESKFLHISGFKKNSSNFANLMGAMESMRYIAGIIAGARAMEDGARIVGAVEPFPIPEVIRLLNAFAIGVRETCPECAIKIRWINSWFDPVREKEAAQSLLEAGAQVVVTGTDTPGPVVAAAQAGRWGIGYDSRNACDAAPDNCLTTTYWDWGPTYLRIVEQIKAGTFKAEDIYLDVDSGLVGLLGFEEGQTPAKGIPVSVIPRVRELHAAFKSGKMTRFDVFAGPLKDNQGRTVLRDGEKMTQEDLEGLTKVEGRKDCTICMSWLAEGIEGTIPAKQ